jgi:outer membrane receptor for ferrienterochelin and colicin
VIALGYLPQIQRIDVGSAASVVVRLENAAVVLDSMRIVAQRARTPANPVVSGFEHRRHNGIGTFLTAQQIAATHALVVTDIVRHLDGVHLAMPRGTGSEIVVSNRGAASFGATICPLDVFLDGTRVTSADINMVTPSSLHDLEIHSVATAPPQYKVGNCGAIFLWTR